ncbi:MAG: Tn3 family transposase [Solirubrobacteraceae bacterium]
MFARFDLLGLSFIPRLRDAGDLRLHRLGESTGLPVDVVLRSRVRPARTVEQYDHLLRTAASSSTCIHRPATTGRSRWSTSKRRRRCGSLPVHWTSLRLRVVGRGRFKARTGSFSLTPRNRRDTSEYSHPQAHAATDRSCLRRRPAECDSCCYGFRGTGAAVRHPPYHEQLGRLSRACVGAGRR